MTALNAVAVMRPEENALAPAVSDALSTIQMIERAARDPHVDIEKMRELRAMLAQDEAKAAERDFDEAMSKTQAEMSSVAVDSHNTQTRSRYASYYAIDRVLRPIYTANGFALSFGTGQGAPSEHVRVTCHVSHRGGHSRDYLIDMPSDGKGARGGDVMTRTHATGSALTYGMRYLLKMIFNVAIGEDDDDGNGRKRTIAANGGELVSNGQIEVIRSLIVDTGSDIQKFCAYMGVPTIGDIPADKAKGAIAVLQRKQALQRKEEAASRDRAAEGARASVAASRDKQQDEERDGIPGFLDRRKAVRA